ncbi:MAG: aspartate/glutamate racemase family protein [Candidatus Caenarcaniphilales bacterium]|nr:aspartate/glutamate racemase family protein [Candidatus Caenarcaniphilales bacterium]
MKIAFLDSGVGGLTVLNSFVDDSKKAFDSEPISEITYLADLANLPYGGKSQEELKLILLNNLQWLQSRADSVVLACNTSSAILDSEIERQFPNVKIYGLIQAFAKDLALNHKNLKKLVVLSTRATHNSGAYINMLKQSRPDLEVQSVPCPEWVPLIEDNLSKGYEPLQELAEESVKKIINQIEIEADALVFGCTHYPLLKGAIKKLLPKVLLLDPADSIRKELSEFVFSPTQTSITTYSSSNEEVLKDKLKSLDKILLCAKYCQNKVKAAQIIGAKA